MIRYYLTQRPPAPGTFPGKPVNLKSFDKRTHVEEIGRPAWGWVEYEWPLTIKEAEDYELTRPIKFNRKKNYYLVSFKLQRFYAVPYKGHGDERNTGHNRRRRSG